MGLNSVEGIFAFFGYREMRKRIKALFRGQKGLSLVEVLAAVAILGFIGPAFMLALSNISWNTNTHEGKVTAASLVQSQLEVIKAAPYDNAAPYYDDIETVACPTGYEISITTEKVDDHKQNVTVGVSRSGSSVLQITTVKVDW